VNVFGIDWLDQVISKASLSRLLNIIRLPVAAVGYQYRVFRLRHLPKAVGQHHAVRFRRTRGESDLEIADLCLGVRTRVRLDEADDHVHAAAAHLVCFLQHPVRFPGARGGPNVQLELPALTLSHQLGMTVLAEGVETAAQVGYLRRNECDYFQGYYFCKPVTAPRALEMLQHRYLAHEGIEQPAEQQPTLLLVDDEENILNALTRMLRRDGYRILTATNAQDALDILGRNDVQVVISDQRMPGISGTELLSKVKEMHPETVRMVLSGYTDLSAVTAAINQGAIYKFLTKPWNDEELRLQIRDAFRIARRPRESRNTDAPA